MSERRQTCIQYIFIFAFLVVLCALFPWSGDDWAWGSTVGQELIDNGFRDYNGRYLGNLLVVALTRSRLLRACFMAATHTGLLFLLSGLARGFKGKTAMIAILLFLMPTAVFAQAIAWTSGFSNYVPSIVISLAYIYLVRNIFDRREPEYKRGSVLLAFVLGVAGGLFIEHITIYNIYLGTFVLVYSFLRFKRAYAQHVAFFVGAVIGAVIMFSNGAYRAVSQGTDWYRSVPQGITGILGRAWINTTSTIIPYGFTGSCGLLTILCVAAYIVSGVYRGQIDRKWATWHETTKSIITAYTAIVIIENTCNVEYVDQWKVFEMIVTIIYLLSWLVFYLSLPMDSIVKAKLMLYYSSAILLIGCLLIVTPIGPRCLFASYVFFSLIAISLLDVAFQSGRINMRVVRDVVTICVTVFAYYFVSIYGSIALFEYARIVKIREDLAQGNTTLYVQNMIYDEYVWNGDPTVDLVREKRFKQFYGIDEKIKIESAG